MVARILLVALFASVSVAFLWLAVRALSSGKVRIKDFVDQRSSSPVGYWFAVCFYLVGGIGSAVGAALIALA